MGVFSIGAGLAHELLRYEFKRGVGVLQIWSGMNVKFVGRSGKQESGERKKSAREQGRESEHPRVTEIESMHEALSREREREGERGEPREMEGERPWCEG